MNLNTPRPPKAATDTDPFMQDCISFAKSQPIEIHVGPEPVIFYVHKACLCSASEYFVACLNENWKGGHAKKLIWNESDDRVAYADTLVGWLYSEDPYENLSDRLHPVDYLLECYKFADKRMIVDFQNYLMDIIYAKLEEDEAYMSISSIRKISELGLLHTPLYTYAVKSFVKGVVMQNGDFTGQRAFNEDIESLTDLVIAKDIIKQIHDWSTQLGEVTFSLSLDDFYVRKIDQKVQGMDEVNV